MFVVKGIDSLAETVDTLPAKEKELFQRIFKVTVATGEQNIPQSMQPWVSQCFGSVASVASQKIIKVNNLVTGEGTLFNRLRAYRPIEAKDRDTIHKDFKYTAENDMFSSPERSTPADVFGRVTGRYCVTASNVAKYDGMHGLVIFNDADPLGFTREQVIDYIDTGWQWARKAHALQPENKYPFFIWNCLWRAGASILHGHAHVMLTGGQHYAKLEGLRRAAMSYEGKYSSSYFDGLYEAHQSTGCALTRDGVRILTSLTPFKDNEIIIMGKELSLQFKESVYDVLEFYRDKKNITSFNLSIVTPPLAETEECWDSFPVIARLVDRGDPDSRTSDVGAMEIYASSVVSGDPVQLAGELKSYLGYTEEAHRG